MPQVPYQIKQLFVVCILFIFGNSYGQFEKGMPSSSSLQDLIVRQWSTRDGLFTNKINDVVQSKDGFLWITTYHGIIRFDGNKFDIFNKSNTPSFQADTYYDILLRSDSVVLFLSRGSGIVQYSNGEFMPYEFNTSLPSSIGTAFLDSKQNLWITTFDNVIIEHNGKIEKLDHELISKGIVLEMTEDKDGNIYFATDGKGVVKYDGTNFTQFTVDDGLADNVIISITQGINGSIVTGSFKGISIIQNESIRTISYTNGARVNDIFVDDYANILLATDLGLYRINERENIYEKIVEGNRLPAREINSIDIDHENNIWLGMEKAGLIRLKEGKFSNLTENDGLSLNRINIVVQRSDSEYWVGSDNGDVDIVNSKDNLVHSFKSNNLIDNKGIRDFLFDSKGNIWIASYNGLLKITGKHEFNYTDQNGLSSSLVRRVIEDSSGNIWIGTRNGGVNKISPIGTVEKFDLSNGLLVNYILDLMEDENGTVYAATNRGGVAKIDPQGKITNYTDFGGGVDLVNFNLSRDSKGRIWVTNSNGLFYLNNDRFLQVRIRNFTESEAFFDLVDDNQGSFWLTTNAGLLEITEAQIEDYIDGEIHSVNSNLFDNNDGMVSRECTAATRSILSNNGTIWIPTIGGVTILNPSKVILNNHIPQVHITEFIVDEISQDINKPIVINPNHVRCKISYTSLSFRAPENVRFKYKLEGVDQDWVETNADQRDVQYTNLPYGEYTFRVLACNNDGIWNEKGDSVRFKVNPFIYETTWFYVISTLVTVIGFLSIARWREQKINRRNDELQKLNAELDSFVYSTSHDLRAPLASVLGLINIARLESAVNKKDSYLNMMEDSIKKLDNFIQDIIDYSRNSRTNIKYESFNVKSTIDEIILGLKFLDPNDEIKCDIEVNGDGKLYCDKQRVTIILNNIISNAFKYYDQNKEQSRIKIKMDLEDPLVIIILVEDNGIGIDQQDIDKVFGMFYRGTDKSKGSGIGLYIVQEAVIKLKGKITVDSKLGEGTIFDIRIPKR